MSKTIKVKFGQDVILPRERYYLTPEKQYIAECSGISNPLWAIIDDEGDEILIVLKECAHLRGGDWQVVEESE